MKLFLDRGNSSIKWGAHDGTQWVAGGRLVLGVDDNADFSALPTPDAVFYASVASAARDVAMLDRLSHAWQCPVKLVETSSEAAGVRCAYADPSRLGVDRWLAVLAAFQPGVTSIAVDAGTAITIDAVGPDGLHLGGLIAPGISLMQRALYSNTDRIPDEGDAGIDVPFLGRDTREAVIGGSVQAAAGFIDRVVSELRTTHGETTRCLLTGGDGERLRSELRNEFEWRPRLVLDGMLRIANESAVAAQEDT